MLSFDAITIAFAFALSAAALIASVWAALRADAAHSLARKALADSTVAWVSRPDDPV